MNVFLNRSILVAIALALVIALAFPGLALAAEPQPCGDNNDKMCLPFIDMIQAQIINTLKNALIGAMYNISVYLWFAVQLITNALIFVLSGDLISLVRDALLGQIATLMPEVLSSIVGGPSGLFVLALMLAGLLMTFPFLGAQNIVNPSRVFIWGAILTALFISGTFGYDLITGIERLRIGIMEDIVTGDNSSMFAMVTTPMQASNSDLTSFLALPPNFVDTFFPTPSPSDFDQVTAKLSESENILTQALEQGGALEKDTSINERVAQARAGWIIALMTLGISLILGLFTLIFVVLGAAALTLIVALIAALPLGFFEVGGAILGAISRQYVYVFGLSILAGVMARVITTMSSTILRTSDFAGDLGQAFTNYIVFAIPGLMAGYMLSFILKMAVSAMTATGSIIESATSTALGSPVASGAGAESGGAGMGDRLGQAAVAGAIGVATGGASLGLMAALGAVAGGSSGSNAVLAAGRATQSDDGGSGSFESMTAEPERPFIASSQQPYSPTSYAGLTDPYAPDGGEERPLPAREEAMDVGSAAAEITSAPLSNPAGMSYSANGNYGTMAGSADYGDMTYSGGGVEPTLLADAIRSGGLGGGAGAQTAGLPPVTIEDTSAMASLQDIGEGWTTNQMDELFEVTDEVVEHNPDAAEAQTAVYDQLKKRQTFRDIPDQELREAARNAVLVNKSAHETGNSPGTSQE